MFRPNLYFSVSQKSSNILNDLKSLMKSEKITTENGEKTVLKFSGPTIIYCQTKKMTTDIVNLLRSIRIKCDQYHAGLSLPERKATQIQFINDQLDVTKKISF